MKTVDKKTKKAFDKRNFAVSLAECAIFTALITATAYIKIPFPVMPLTFQTVTGVLAGLLLGWKKGVASMTAYALMGLIGLPVFTSGGGFFYVLQPSFGYILGFIASAAVAGAFYGRKLNLWQCILLALAGFVADYVVGILYFIVIWQVNGYAALWQAVVTYNLVYMPKDAVLCVIAGILAFRVRPIVQKRY